MIEDTPKNMDEKQIKNQIFEIPRFTDKRRWFSDGRFGLFIHWGIYAVGGLQEQEFQRYGRKFSEYNRYIPRFRAEKFDPEKWLDQAQAAGMEYLVFTSKHHDGFCMWDTNTTDYNVMHTAFGRDPIAELTAACKKRNFPLMIYYSCLDWHHPAYPNIGRHHETVTDPSLHNMEQYMEYVKSQVHELCTRYDGVYGIWWDMNVPEDEFPEINQMVRKLIPGGMVNSRGWGKGDTITPERDFNPIDPSVVTFTEPTECCDSIGLNSWGFRQEEDYYTADELKRRLVRSLARGGNYLLNIGPQANGELPQQGIELRTGIGSWYNKVKSALTAPPCTIGIAKPDLFFTAGSARELNVIINHPLESTTLDLRPLTILPVEAVVLNNRTDLEITAEPVIYHKALGETVRLRDIPCQKGAEPTVISLKFDRDIF